MLAARIKKVVVWEVNCIGVRGLGDGGVDKLGVFGLVEDGVTK